MNEKITNLIKENKIKILGASKTKTIEDIYSLYNKGIKISLHRSRRIRANGAIFCMIGKCFLFVSKLRKNKLLVSFLNRSDAPFVSKQQ